MRNVHPKERAVIFAAVWSFCTLMLREIQAIVQRSAQQWDEQRSRARGRIKWLKRKQWFMPNRLKTTVKICFALNQIPWTTKSGVRLVASMLRRMSVQRRVTLWSIVHHGWNGKPRSLKRVFDRKKWTCISAAVAVTIEISGRDRDLRPHTTCTEMWPTSMWLKNLVKCCWAMRRLTRWKLWNLALDMNQLRQSAQSTLPNRSLKTKVRCLIFHVNRKC